MASTFSPNLRIELIGYGEQNNTWGTTTNTNLGTLIEQAIAGKAAVDVTAGNVTLTAVDGATDQSRQMILAITGTPGVARTVTAPSVSKVYVVANGSNAAVTIKMATGTGVAVSSGKAKFVYCDGTDFYEATTEQANAAITNLTVSGTLTASGTITGTGFSNYLASPPAIGSTTASSGAFTTLSASSTVSGTGFSNYLASPPAIGGTAAAAGTFTDLTSTGNTILGDAAADTVVINGTIQPGVVISGSSSSTALRITQTGAGNALVVEDSANPDSSVFQIDATGLVTANNQITRSGATSGTNGYGFSAESSLIGATNNYGFYSNIASGAGRFNFYAAGTAENYFAGKVGVGISGSSSGIANAFAITGGANAQGYRLESTINSDVTNQARGYVTFLSTQATAFTLLSIYHYHANQSTLGAGSTVTNQMGFMAEGTLIGATNNYGFYSAIASGTGRYNFYAAGTADNYFAGAIKGNTTIAGGYTALAAGTTAMALGSNKVVKVTPNATASFTTTVAPAGATASIIIVTSGTTSYTITFGTGFLTTGTLATGTVTAKTFVVNFVSDGTTMIETSRTVAM